MTKIILLDVDGVLVRPGGYRAALRATLHRFWNAHFHLEFRQNCGRFCPPPVFRWDK